MRFIRVLAIAIWLAASWSGAAEAADAPAGEPAAEQGFRLDEYAAFVSGASGAWQIGAGLTIGNSFKGDFHLFGGGRISWVQADALGESSNGWGLGAVGGLGYRPAEAWSPVVTLAWDKLFGMDDTYGSRLTTSAGIRWRLGPRLDQHHAVSVLFFGSTLFGSGSVPDAGDYGLTVAYSLAFYD